MTRAEALSLGYCDHCASYAGRQWCAVGRRDNLCPLTGDCFGEWLRQTFRLPGPPVAEGLGAYEELKAARKDK